VRQDDNGQMGRIGGGDDMMENLVKFREEVATDDNLVKFTRDENCCLVDDYVLQTSFVDPEGNKLRFKTHFLVPDEHRGALEQFPRDQLLYALMAQHVPREVEVERGTVKLEDWTRLDDVDVERLGRQLERKNSLRLAAVVDRMLDGEACF
jgi:hypothetical protein